MPLLELPRLSLYIQPVNNVCEDIVAVIVWMMKEFVYCRILTVLQHKPVT